MHMEKANHANIAAGELQGAMRDTRSRKRKTGQGGLIHHGPAIEAGRRALASATGKQSHSAPVPIWFAALVASNCRASSEGVEHPIDWVCESGRALYTNCESHSEWIESLGVGLHSGDTLSVTWIPGETAYTVEILHTLDYVA